MALVLERTVVNITYVVVISESDGLKSIGRDRGQFLYKALIGDIRLANIRIIGVIGLLSRLAVATRSEDTHEMAGDLSDTAAVAEHDVLDAGIFKSRTKTTQIRGEYQGLDAIAELVLDPLLYQISVIADTDERAAGDGEESIVRRRRTEIYRSQMALVPERAVPYARQMIVLSEADGLKDVAAERAAVKARMTVAGARSAAPEEIAGDIAEQASVAEDEVLYPRVHEFRPQRLKVGGEGQGLDAFAKLVIDPVFNQVKVVARSDKGPSLDGEEYFLRLGRTEIDRGQMGLVPERTGSYFLKAVVLSEAYGLKGVGAEGSAVEARMLVGFARSVGIHETAGQIGHQAAVAEHEILNSCQFESAVIDLRKIGGESQGLDAFTELFIDPVLGQITVVARADEGAVADLNGDAVRGRAEIDIGQMALVPESSGAYILDLIVFTEADGLKVIGADLYRIINESAAVKSGTGVFIRPGDLHETVRYGYDAAAVAEYEVLYPGGIESAVLELSQVGRQYQSVDAAKLFFAFRGGKAVIARGDEGTETDDKVFAAFADVDLGQMGLVLEGAHVDELKGIAVSYIYALKAVAGFGDILGGTDGRFEKFLYESFDLSDDAFEDAVALGTFARSSVKAVGSEEASGDHGQFTVILEDEGLDRLAVEGALPQFCKAGGEPQFFDRRRNARDILRRESAAADLSELRTFFEGDNAQILAVLEGLIEYRRHGSRNSHALKSLFSSERLLRDLVYDVGLAFILDHPRDDQIGPDRGIVEAEDRQRIVALQPVSQRIARRIYDIRRVRDHCERSEEQRRSQNACE